MEDIKKGKVDWVKQAFEHNRLGRYEQAIFACSQALQIDQTFARAHFGKALAFYNLGQMDFALLALKQTIRYNRSHFRAYILAGNIYCHQGEYKRTIRAFSLALQIDPLDENALSGKANAEIQQTRKEFYDAEKQRLLRIEASEHIARGNDYYNKGDYICALEEYNKALRLDPHSLIDLHQRVKICNSVSYNTKTDNRGKQYMIGDDGFIRGYEPDL